MSHQDHALGIQLPFAGPPLHQGHGAGDVPGLFQRRHHRHHPVIARNDRIALRQPVRQLAGEAGIGLVAVRPAAAMHVEHHRCIRGIGRQVQVETLRRIRPVGDVAHRHASGRHRDRAFLAAGLAQLLHPLAQALLGMSGGGQRGDHHDGGEGGGQQAHVGTPVGVPMPTCRAAAG
jgi:hypothetical protein